MNYLKASFISTLVMTNMTLAFAQIEPSDMQTIATLRPTTYYIPSEVNVSCKGKYGSTNYTGKEIQDLITPEGKHIATVCKRFASVLLMEGSAVLKDRGAGEIVVNYGSKVKGQPRYRILDRCKYGQGVRADLCLLPYHTIAADNRIHKIDDIIYIPALKGIQLPDGTLHDGVFIVRDTGGAFDGVGSQRVDLFVGTDPDDNNAFQRSGYDRTHPLKAFKIKGQSADRLREKLKEQFGDLY